MRPRPGSIKVLLVDDHPVVREGLRIMLTETGIDVVGDVGTARDAIQLTAKTAPDVVLLDMGLPDLDGVTALKRIKQVRPASAVLVLTMHDAPALVRGAVQAGAAGYLLKGVSRRELLSALCAVRDGDAVLDPSLLRSLTSDAPGKPSATPALTAVQPLTPVERDVLRLVAVGLTNREIAGRLRWSVATVKKYVRRLLAKLDASDRTQAAVAAVRRGLLPDDA
jgi:DNA-binding NarL/FixJ family response regulator